MFWEAVVLSAILCLQSQQFTETLWILYFKYETMNSTFKARRRKEGRRGGGRGREGGKKKGERGEGGITPTQTTVLKKTFAHKLQMKYLSEIIINNINQSFYIITCMHLDCRLNTSARQYEWYNDIIIIIFFFFMI